MAYLNVLLPVYNEQERLESGIARAAAYLDTILPGDYVLTIVDNASIDATESIARRLAAERDSVRYLRITEKGVGAAFRAGVAANDSPIVGYMDVDLSTDIAHLAQVVEIFRGRPDVGMVNGSRWSEESQTRGRTPLRNFTSHGLTFVLKHALAMEASDAICGFKFFRAEVVERLIGEADCSENGWFFIIELLLRAERDGICVVELPVRWDDDHRSTVRVAHQVHEYLTQIRRLRRQFRAEGLL